MVIQMAEAKGQLSRSTKLPAIVTSVRKSAVKLLDRPASELVGHQAFKADRKILALWAADCAEHVLPFFEEKYPTDDRPRKAIEACRAWVATGMFRMAAISRVALAAHAAAREAKGQDAVAAARAAGHAIATAHVTTHSFGAAAYAIKAAAAHSHNVNDGIVKERTWQLHRLLEYARLRNSGISITDWPTHVVHSSTLSVHSKLSVDKQSGA
jgi:hypothetical protein